MKLVLAATALISTVLGTAHSADAESAPTATETLADEAGVDAVDLRGAAATTGLSPRRYLESVGELIVSNAPGGGMSDDGGRPSLAAPVSALASRVACIESKESGGANVWNRGGSGAGGVMQYFPSTFARGAREMGHPEWSLWEPAQARAVAAHDLAMGRRAQWTVGGC